MMKNLSLVEKAKATKITGVAAPDEAIEELVIAWVKDEIRLTQASAALGNRRNTSAVYYQAAIFFKKLYMEGRIVIKDKKQISQ